MQRVENLYRKSNKYTTVSLVLPTEQQGTRYSQQPPGLQNSHLSCDRCMYLHVFKCDPTFTVIVVDIIRLHLRAKTGFCTQCCPILKNTLSYIFQINIGPFLLVCQVHLPETPSEPQTYLYSIDFSIHEYTLLSHPFAHPLIFSLRLSGGKITFTCYTCFNHPLMRSSLLI